MDRKKSVLLILLLLLGISVIYRIEHPFRQKRVSELTYGPGKSDRVVTMKIRSNIGVNREDRPSEASIRHLPDAPAHTGTVKRNPFFIEKERPPISIPPETNRTNESQTFIDSLAQAKEAMNRLTVLGLYETTGDKAVFLQRGKEMLLVREGDRIDGKYRVTEITNQSIVILAEALNEIIRIDMERF